MNIINSLSKRFCISSKIFVQHRRYCSIKVERVRPETKGPIIKFLHENFVYDEPVNKSINMMKSREEPNPGWDRYFSEVLDKGASLKYEKSGVTAAAIVCFVKDGNNGFEKVVTHDPKFKKYLDFLVNIESNCNIYKTCQVDQYYFIDCFSVHRDYRESGLIYSFIDHIEETGRQLGCKLLAGITTNSFATLAAKNIGMEPIYSLKYEDYKVNGEVVFKTTKPHLQTTVLVKHI